MIAMKISNLLIYVLLLINHAVSGQRSNDKLIILKFDFANIGPINMSEIISEINYIPLETKPNCLLGYMNIPVFGRDIIVKAGDDSRAILRFSNQGKFLNKIGNQGRGPEEYLDFCDVRLIGDTVFVVSNFSNSVICYSLTGSFLKKYHVNIKARPKSIVQLSDKSFMISLSNPSNLGNIIKTDREFNIKTGFIKNVPLNDNPLPFRFQKSKNKVFYYYNFIDTIFEISRGFPIPSIIIDYGRYSRSREKFSLSEKDNAYLIKPYILNFNTSDGYFNLTVSYPFNKTAYSILYRLTDGKQFSWSDLINDIDKGTLDRWSGYLTDDNLFFVLMPSTILARFEKMTNSEKLDPKNSRFVNMATKITLESNPVIMICKLK
jgi:hypothetical protein